MGIEFTANTHDGDKCAISLDTYPDRCPSCKQAGHPRPVFSHLDHNFSFLQIVFACPITRCGGLYIGDYRVYSNGGRVYGPGFDGLLNRVASCRLTSEIAFPATIQQISPTFCKIYNESAAAEANGLGLICGPGYRKALEYLIKDYLINYTFKDDAGKKEQIAHTLLGPCIDNFVDEIRIKTAAKRAAWLGNDETHYTRKWVDKDISDLKTLISMTVSWIDLVVQSDNYEEGMKPEKGKRN